jgi:hypothetical protein
MNWLCFRRPGLTDISSSMILSAKTMGCRVVTALFPSSSALALLPSEGGAFIDDVSRAHAASSLLSSEMFVRKVSKTVMRAPKITETVDILSNNFVSFADETKERLWPVLSAGKGNISCLLLRQNEFLN